jgi:hypothetical protein
MREFFLSGRFVDVALAVIGLESIVLLTTPPPWGFANRRLDLLGQLLAGALLLLAVRCCVTGADYRVTLLILAASFPAHAFDLFRRARRDRPL